MALDLQARGMAAQVQTNLDEYIETFKNGMKFVGISSTDPLVSGATVSGYSDWAVGNIVLYNDKEYLLTASLNIVANWIKFGEDNSPFSTGAGHDSAVLVATPNETDPSVDRTNTVTGDFSAVLAGSRNDISATESGAVGGIVHISGGGNDFGTGYRQTLQDCENSISNGYRNTLTYCSQVAAFGRGLTILNCSNGIFAGYNIEALGSENAKLEANALFGYDISSTASCGLSIGMHNVLSNNVSATIGDHLITSRYAQTNVGQYNKVNNQAYFVVGSGQGEGADRKNCFAAGWDGNAGDEAARKVTWFGDTRFSEKTLHQLLVGMAVSFLPRIDKNDSWWATNSTIGRVDQWGGTDVDNVEKKGKIFAIYGNSNSSEHTSHVVFIISTGAVSESNRNCNGEIILHVSGDAAARIISSYI